MQFDIMLKSRWKAVFKFKKRCSPSAANYSEFDGKWIHIPISKANSSKIYLLITSSFLMLS